MSHANARLTVHGRLLIVQRRQAGMPKAHIAASMGVSRGCVKKWIDRFDQEGLAGLHDRSSRPHRRPSKTSDEVEQQILELRRVERRGPDWIGAERIPRPSPSQKKKRPGGNRSAPFVVVKKID